MAIYRHVGLIYISHSITGLCVISHLIVWAWCDTVPLYMRMQVSLSCLEQSWHRKHTIVCKYEPACVTGGTREVGTFDPLLMDPSPRSSWTPDPMGTFTKGNLYTYIHTSLLVICLSLMIWCVHQPACCQFIHEGWPSWHLPPISSKASNDKQSWGSQEKEA